ncbi:flagellar filament capping protein FliD [Stenotrophomonas rhizophila]|uniref:flagellar filament capping protein FliD n=1 Tax=Stenotrophomonas rhizophila TaxID=216778 RepID=UPI001E2BE544|nr:flagellar filament capping protein FliD [Stenotrophomonas rhizophila]MCC7635296.1 flagellar filament capping protein FliD [Stenotrophomonas rhizophila]MCC7663171.1 flagellar filament capping protein FliD [Stenotrophomonas rhizophila]
MADFGYGGIGSGLDISGMVASLVAADRKPSDNALNLQQSKAKMQLSAVGTVKSAFDLLSTSLKALKASTAFDARLVSATKSGTDDILTVTSTNSAATGSHEIDVQQLATANKWIADTAIPKTQTFGAGTLSLEVGVGDKKKTLEIQVEADDTLSSIRTKIEKAGRSLGVQATLIASGDNQFLSLSQEKAGTANAIKLSAGAGNAGLTALAASMSERTPAADAKLTIDGVAVVASENTVTDVVPGLTLNLKKAGKSTVTVSTDVAAARKVMQDFVTAYNGAISAINTATKYDMENKEPSSLTGDAQMRGASSQLRAMMGGVLKDLAAVGLDPKTLGLQTRAYPNADGSLVLDGSKFEAALVNQAGAVRQALTGDDGAAAKLFTMVDGYVSTTVGKEGAFVSRSKSITASLTDIDKRRKSLDVRMAGVEARYKKQFLALDALMGKLSQTTSSLSSQLSQLSG